jgi:subtilase family serine protease
VPGGDYQSESVWNEGTASSGGGGLSVVYSRPDYQAPVVKDSLAREVPDISYNAGVFGGVLAALTCPGPAACGAPAGTYFFRFGGTSAGSPQWAALTAIADQEAGGRVGDINKTLYKLGKGNTAGTYFHDTTVGDNSQPGLGITGFSAVPGWDAASGWGSPKADTLVPAIAKPGNG